MKYKVGDRVRIKSLDWYNENKDDSGVVLIEDGDYMFCQSDTEWCGKIVTIKEVCLNEYYRIEEDFNKYRWTDEMIEGLVEEPVLSAPNITEGVYIHEKDMKWITEYILPDGYIFKDENGNVINATKIVLEKKKKEYPKTYEECCKVMGIDSTINHTIGTHFRYRDTIEHFIKLLICRDAYWKIAGEEMGLGKPWEPDWNANELKYIIYYENNKLWFNDEISRNTILAFPTKEIRDAFYENFKELIESCKELL